MTEVLLLIHWARLQSFVRSASSGAGELSAIESAVIVVTSYLLTVCVAKYQNAELLLPVNCCLFTLQELLFPVPVPRVFLHICE
ncbi:hypothetical protein AVEN_56440-1 [Araneus ventricosus]|uniref:Uncharacterized protein n=1 Tax=Araneus ventricosus TaxID=182803 RepID=A0A4Y2RF78_ARAVE|nr:hypothetical protein AVEN_56440-1 [Araneus ventricosus]